MLAIYFKNNLYQKNKKINFVILDTGMNDFIRPTLYKAYHKIIPTKKLKIKFKNIDMIL